MGDALSGGVMVAVAAALWIAYLLPSWLHRRQYIATERNAVRLQQTLRILAETAETPEQVRLETTARAAASQERVLRERESAERARLKAAETIAATERRAAEREAAEAVRRAKAAADAGRSRSRTIRRARAISSLVLLVSLGAVGVGIAVAVTGQSWMLAVSGVGGTFASMFALSSLARSRPSAAGERTAVATAEPSRERFEPVEWAESAAPAATAWTPRPLPRPLTLERGSIAAAAMDSVEAAAALRRAAVFAAMSEKAAAMNPTASPVPLRSSSSAAEPAAVASASPVATDSRFARMGIVDDTAPGMADLDAVLRRRRTA
jgi:hypothetical protein